MHTPKSPPPGKIKYSYSKSFDKSTNKHKNKPNYGGYWSKSTCSVINSCLINIASILS